MKPFNLPNQAFRPLDHRDGVGFAINGVSPDPYLYVRRLNLTQIELDIESEAGV